MGMGAAPKTGNAVMADGSESARRKSGSRFLAKKRAERIAFVELSDGHNELFRSVVQSLLSDMTTRRTATA